MRNGYLLLAISSIFSATANFLLKYSGKKSFENFSPETNVFIFYGMAVLAYACGFIFYALALRQENVIHAYPTMVGFTILCIFLWNIISGSEKIETHSFIGSIVIIFGILIISIRK